MRQVHPDDLVGIVCFGTTVPIFVTATFTGFGGVNDLGGLIGLCFWASG